MKSTLSLQAPRKSSGFENITMMRRLLSSQSSKTQISTTPAFTSSSREAQQLPVRNLSSLPVVEEEVHHDHEGEEKDVFTTSTITTTHTSPLHKYVGASPTKSHLSYVADISFPITSELKIVKPTDDAPSGIWPVYRIMVSLHEIWYLELTHALIRSDCSFIRFLFVFQNPFNNNHISIFPSHIGRRRHVSNRQ